MPGSAGWNLRLLGLILRLGGSIFLIFWYDELPELNFQYPCFDISVLMFRNHYDASMIMHYLIIRMNLCQISILHIIIIMIAYPLLTCQTFSLSRLYSSREAVLLAPSSIKACHQTLPCISSCSKPQQLMSDLTESFYHCWALPLS